MAESDPTYAFDKFAGYSTPNTTQIPDEFLDHQMASLTGAEVKVMLYVFRRTLGFKRYADNISLNQLLTGIVRRDGTRLDCGTGLSKSTLLNAIRSLVEKRLILVEQRHSDERGNEPTTYRLNFQSPFGIKNDLGESENRTPLGAKNALGEGENSDTLGIKNDLGVARKLDQALVLKIAPTIYSSTTNSVTTDSKDNNNTDAVVEPEPKPVVVALLTSRGLAKRVAEVLSTEHDEEAIRAKVAYLEFLQRARPNEVQKPAAWLRRAIEDDYGAPDGYVSEVQIRAQEAEEARQRQAGAANARKKAKQQEQAAKQREKKLEALRRQYGTAPGDQMLWNIVLNEIKATGEADLEKLLTDALVLKLDGSTFVVGIEAVSAAQQLSHPRMQALTKKIIKRALRQDLDVQFVRIEPS